MSVYNGPDGQGGRAGRLLRRHARAAPTVGRLFGPRARSSGRTTLPQTAFRCHKPENERRGLGSQPPMRGKSSSAGRCGRDKAVPRRADGATGHVEEGVYRSPVPRMAGCLLQQAGCRVQKAGCRLPQMGCRLQRAEYRLQREGYLLQQAEYRVQKAGCRVLQFLVLVDGLIGSGGCRLETGDDARGAQGGRSQRGAQAAEQAGEVAGLREGRA